MNWAHFDGSRVGELDIGCVVGSLLGCSVNSVGMGVGDLSRFHNSVRSRFTRNKELLEAAAYGNGISLGCNDGY